MNRNNFMYLQTFFFGSMTTRLSLLTVFRKFRFIQQYFNNTEVFRKQECLNSESKPKSECTDIPLKIPTLIKY